MDVGERESFGYSLECGGNLVKGVFLIADEIHLVNRKDDIANAEERCDMRMTQCLGEDAVLGIN